MYTSDFVNCLIKYGIQCYTTDGHERDKVQINNDINNIWESLSQDMKDDIIFNWYKQNKKGEDIVFKKVILNIIDEDIEKQFKEKCNDKAKEIFINFLKTEEGNNWLTNTYIDLLKNHPYIDDVKICKYCLDD